jgi:hypothetical protein
MLPTSPLRSSQRDMSLSTLILAEWLPRSSSVSTIKSPRRRGQYKFSEVHHNLDDSWTTPSSSRGRIPKNNEYTKLVDEVLSWRLSGLLKGWLKSLLGRLDWIEAWGREILSSRECVKVYFKWIEWPTELERCGGPFIAPKGICSLRCQRPGHVRVEGRTCPANHSGTQPGNRTSPILSLNLG